MGRKLVVCCDGTWNDPDDQTNVHRTFQLLRRSLGDLEERPIGDDRRVASGTAPDGQACLAYYDTGVGTKRGQRGSGGIFGAGLGENVRQAYAFLAEHARPGDELYLIGFSRGAFTVRSLCGMLGCAGLPGAFATEAVADAWAYYRTPPKDRPGRAEALGGHAPWDTFVRFLGVYDTVGALGVPVPQLSWLNGPLERLLGGVIRFHDTALGRNVQTACQALAIHERRGTFKPVVWSRAPGRVRRPDGSEAAQEVLQVWFAGSHGNVGGGYPTTDLSDIAFEWMARRAIACGLPADEGQLAAMVAGNSFGARYDSDRGWLGRVSSGDTFRTVRRLAGGLPLVLGPVAWAADLCANLFAVRPAERRIGGEIEADDGSYSVAVGERVHASVIDRYRGEHVPASVRCALAAKVEVFRERAEPRSPGGAETVLVNGVRCDLRDVSRSGALVAKAGWLEPGTEVRFERAGWPPCAAAVVWRQGDAAGLRLAAKLGPAARPSPPPSRLRDQLLGEQGGAGHVLQADGHRLAPAVDVDLAEELHPG